MHLSVTFVIFSCIIAVVLAEYEGYRPLFTGDNAPGTWR